MAEPRTVRENANTLSSVQIAEILPHRYPFALVDRILDYEPGQWAIGRKCVTRNEEFFNGHFPAQPVMPGVLLLEALAQTGAVAALSLPENKGKLALFGGIEAVFTALALRDQFAPPTIHYAQPDPECDLDYVPNTGRQQEMQYALSNSLGFGGHNACIALRRWEG